LLPIYDASLATHIITDTSMISTLNALGLKRLTEIPDHIPTITWKWIEAGIGRVNKEGWKDEVFLHAAFHERMEAGIKHSRKGKEKANDNADFSRISCVNFLMIGCVELSQHPHSEFTQDKLRRQTSVHSIHSSEDDDAYIEENDRTAAQLSLIPSVPKLLELQRRKSTDSNISTTGNRPKKLKDDPLAEFYAQARAEHETGVGQFLCITAHFVPWAEPTIQWSPTGEGDDSDLTPSDVEVEEQLPKAVAKRVFILLLFIYNVLIHISYRGGLATIRRLRDRPASTKTS
jgi:hypothetical protein